MLEKESNRRVMLSMVVLGALLPIVATAGQPYTPSDPHEIVQRLPGTAARPTVTDASGPSVRSVQQARSDALAYLALAQRSGDARYLGYAQGVLLPWRSAATLPNALLLPQAISEQARHDFTAALSTLDRLLADQPGDTQAWLTRSVILQVTGQYEAALESCQRLAGRTSRLVLATCLAGGQRLSEDAPRAYRVLHSAIADATGADRDVATWSLLVLADLADSTGDVAMAREALETAVQLDGEDIRPSLAYADFLLRQGDAATVLDVVAPDSPVPMLLLRRALATKALNRPHLAPDLDRLCTQLQAYFVAAARRGDDLHQREAALANLMLFDQPTVALDLALRNWERQREFEDTRLVLTAAAAARNPEAAHGTLQWLREQGTVDKRLVVLMDRLGGAGIGDAL